METNQIGPQLGGQWLDRLQAILEVLLLAGLISSFMAALPFGLLQIDALMLTRDATAVALFVILEASIVLLLLVLVLRLHSEPLRSLGLRKDRWLSHLAAGAALVPLLFLINMIVATLFRVLLPGYFLERNPLVDLVKTPRDLVVFLLAALFAGGIKEELQRAFILNRFRDHLGGAWFGLMVWSALFGAGHYLQGLQGVVVATIFGILFGGLYLVRGSLVAPIVAHAIYDTAALLGYWFLAPSAH